MTDVVMFGDARKEAIAILDAALTASTRPVTNGVKVRGKVPSDAPIPLPFVGVVSDGTPVQTWPIVQRTTIHVTCWHNTEAATHELAGLAMAFLLGGHSGQFTGCHPLTGPFDTLDPETGKPMSWFTVHANMHGQYATA